MTIQNIFHLVIVVVTGIRCVEFLFDSVINAELVEGADTELYPFRDRATIKLFYDLPGRDNGIYVRSVCQIAVKYGSACRLNRLTALGSNMLCAMCRC